MILVTGATGSIGGALVEVLSQSGVPFRASSRVPSALPTNVTSVAMDFADRNSVSAALEGVDALFLNSSQQPQMAALQSVVIEEAQAAGIEHVVKISSGSAATGSDKPSWVGRAHTVVEARLRESMMGWTVLRPNYFMQNLLALVDPIKKGVLPFALSKQRLAPVDVRDIALAASTVLGAPPSHAGRVYDITGPESLSAGEIAAVLTSELGWKISHTEIALSSLVSELAHAGAPQWQQEHVAELMSIYSSDPSVGIVTKDFERITRRRASSLARFVRDYARAFHREG